MSFYTRADAPLLKTVNGQNVQVVGVVQERVDPKTVKIEANGPIQAHIPTSLDGVEIGEAYAFIAVVKDDETINVKHMIHIPKEDLDTEVVAKVVAAQHKYSNFFKPDEFDN